MTRRRFTIRTRLTVSWVALFLGFGACLLTLNYLLTTRAVATAPGQVRADVLDELDLPAGIGTDATAADILAQRDVLDVTVADVVDRAAQRAGERLATDVRRQSRRAVAVLTVVAAVAGWWLAGRALAPVRQITATARRISDTNLHDRLAFTGARDELSELADAFDDMLARLDRAFAAQQMFVANASHELRTPLALARTELDIAYADGPPSPAESADMVTHLRAAITRAEQVIERLLLLARGGIVDPREPVSLTRTAADVVDAHAVLSDQLDLRLDLDLQPATVTGDPALLERLVANLVENAIRHNRHGGQFAVATATDADGVTLTVSNDGPRLDPDTIGQLTQPFFRPDQGRTRRDGGAGLGLSIVATIAAAHDATLTIEGRGPGGLDVTVRFPVSRPS